MGSCYADLGLRLASSGFVHEGGNRLSERYLFHSLNFIHSDRSLAIRFRQPSSTRQDAQDGSTFTRPLKVSLAVSLDVRGNAS